MLELYWPYVVITSWPVISQLATELKLKLKENREDNSLTNYLKSPISAISKLLDCLHLVALYIGSSINYVKVRLEIFSHL